MDRKNKIVTRQRNCERLTQLTLGIAPVIFSDEYVQIGRLDPKENKVIADLRQEYGKTHAFRFDSRDGSITNLSICPDEKPLGKIENVEVATHLLLLAEAINCQLIRWVSGSRKILRPSHPFISLSKHDRLLSKVLEQIGIKQIDTRLNVVPKWSFDFRILMTGAPNETPFLGFVVDIGTSNIINIPVSELIERKIDPIGRYVGRPNKETDSIGKSTIRIDGRVNSIEGKTLILDDFRTDSGSNRVDASDVFLEARYENFQAVLQELYPSYYQKVLNELQRMRTLYLSGDGKLTKIYEMVEKLNNSSSKILKFNNGLSARFGALLEKSNPLFPPILETNRPNMLFGANGHEQHTQPDFGIKQYGPFKYAHNPVNDATILVLCDRAAKGRMEQFAKLLRDGVDEQNSRFAGGLIGKFRLTNIRFQFIEIDGDKAQHFTDAISKSLQQLPQNPALAIVLVREAHKLRTQAENPYFIAKSRLMSAGVPVQAIRLETIDDNRAKDFSLNNIALAIYAKIGGLPWVISTPGIASHELVIGVGCAEIGNYRFGDKTRYIGITTLFQGDGRYIVWETTREATIETYAEALLESLRTSIRYVQIQNRWETGDNVRLVFHVYKPLKRIEIEAAKNLVGEMLREYVVEFAFLDISHYHPLQIFDSKQSGKRYWSPNLQRSAVKGVYAPLRGTSLLLGPRVALLQLVGANEVKTHEHGIPKPLLLELHQDSDFSDLTYLVRQTFHFSYMSWRSFFPADEPVTILYSRLIANLLGNLNSVPNWDGATTLNLMRDRRAMWFL